MNNLYVAGLDGYYSVGEYFWQESGERFYCSHLSGRAWVGEEVTFSTNGEGRFYLKEAYVNSLYVNGELVAEGETNSISYIFSQPGVYEVVMRGRTSYDETYGYSYKWSNFEVTMPASEDEVVIKNYLSTTMCIWFKTNSLILSNASVSVSDD